MKHIDTYINRLRKIESINKKMLEMCIDKFIMKYKQYYNDNKLT